MIEWNPADPDAARVFYDLSEWDFEQQAELTSSLADAEIPHGWAGSELVVPEEFEEVTDQIFADVEQRLEVQGRAVPDGGGYGDPAGGDGPRDPDLGDDESVEFVARVITDATTLTEYELGDWAELERELVGDSLAANDIPFRWEGDTLLVPTDDEDAVDAILDEVESGDVIAISADDDGDDTELPFESLNSFFLAGERLRKDPRSADGLERLLEALTLADPDKPPRGVELRIWRHSCELAERLADVLVQGSENRSESDDSSIADDEPTDDEQAMAVAHELHDLLRPLI